jgi:hypothetical protein
MRHRITDTIIKNNDKRLRSDVKWIYTSGLLGKDSLVSVYIDFGIEAANAFDNKKVYTSKLVVNLDLLGLSTAKASKFLIIL